MKKILSLVLILAAVLSLSACGSEFEPIPSTEEEAAVVLTIEYGGERYEVPYEVYRAFFLTYKDEIDGGDESVWEADGASEYIEKINEKIFGSIAEIYSAFYLCDQLGIDVESNEFDEKIEEYISASVDNIIAIYKADAAKEGEKLELSREQAYEIYLQRLKADNLNYSVSILLYRYELALAKIDEYYRGEKNEASVTGYKGGEFEFTKEDVKEFYDSDESVKLIQLYIKEGYGGKDTAEAARLEMSFAASRDELINIIIGKTLATSRKEVERGMLIGKYTLEPTFFYDYTMAAFSLEIGEISDVIEAFDGESNGYYVLYRDEKSDEHFEDNYADVAYAFVSDKIGRIEYGAKEAILESIVLADGYFNVTHSDISM